MNVSEFAKGLKTTLAKHSPEILVGVGIAGMVVTTILAVKSTPKALDCIQSKLYEKEFGEDTLTPLETVEATWKCYIPAAVTGAVSIACIVGASSVNLRRNAALATAYALSETARTEFASKVKEQIGDKKEELVRSAVNQDKLTKNPIEKNEVYLTNKGETIFYDPISGRYFKSDIETVRRIVNEVNKVLVGEGYVSLNDFYEALGLDPIRVGEDVGWRVDKSLIDPKFGAELASDGTPCIVLDYYVGPKYDYNL